jgi:hypothetical protein
MESFAGKTASQDDLVNAMITLVVLSPDELPPECRANFSELLGNVSGRGKGIREKVAGMTDREIHRAQILIGRIADAVARHMRT